MCSEGVSVWFACKLCNSFFLNADDFAYHKKKSHVQQFQNTKFIVFEEQTSPTASPPENWVSFLSPKEETQIHKIISSPAPSSTASDVDINPSGSNCNIKSNRNQEFIEIDLENNKILVFNNNDNDDGSNAAADVTNNCIELNSALNSYSDVHVQQNLLLHSSAEPPSTRCDFTHEKHDKHCSKIIKSTLKNKTNSLKISKLNGMPSPLTSPPVVTLENCKFCSENFNSTVELYVHEHICRLKRQCENIVCVAPHLNFGSSDELNAHNPTLHFPPVSTPTLEETTKGHKTKLANDLENAAKNQIESEFYKIDSDLDPVSNGDDFTEIPDPTTEDNLNCGDLLEIVKTEYIVADSNEEDSEFPGTGVDHDSCELESPDEALAEKEKMIILADNLDDTQAALQLSGFFCISCNKHFGHMQERKEHNKNHHETPDGTRRFECPHPNCETIVSSHYCLKNHIQHVHSMVRPFNCPYPNCKMSFKTLNNKRGHLKLHTMDANRTHLECPYPDCGKKTSSKFNLRSHIRQVHSDVRPFKCPHPNCNQSFKVLGGMNRHLKRHDKWSTIMETKTCNNEVKKAHG